MEAESWLSCEKTAVLQGGFLLAERLCHPTPLSNLGKADWASVCGPVLQAVQEICGGGRGGDTDGDYWRKKIICILWSKLLAAEKDEDDDCRWRENPLFSAQNAFPPISHTVLLEFVKSSGCSAAYAELLCCFPGKALCSELSLLLSHVTEESSAEDLKLLLEVWWELWKGRRPQLQPLKQALEEAFSAQCLRYTCSDFLPQAPKRFKKDSNEPQVSCMPSMLFQTLRQLKEHVDSPELSCFALSNCLDTLYTSFLLDSMFAPPACLDLHTLTLDVCLREGHNGTDDTTFVEIVRETQRDLRASSTPSPFKPEEISWVEALQITCDLACNWQSRGLLSAPDDGAPGPTVLRLKRSLRTVVQAIKDLLATNTLVGGQMEDVRHLQEQLEALEVLSVPDPNFSSTQMARVAMVIIDNRLEGLKDVALLFASQVGWASSGNEWIDCLERNQDIFQTKELVLKLLSTLAVQCQSETNLFQCKKLRSVIVAIFLALPLPCKNETLAGMLASCGKGGLCGLLPCSLSESFEKELNMTFNSIIQSRGQNSLRLAVSAVACAAFQDPEATLCQCCHLSVVNLGAHTLLAQILHQLPGLKYLSTQSSEKLGQKEESLLCLCLRDAAWSKLSSPKEEQQFLQFLVALMEPSTVTEEMVKGVGLLSPDEVVRAFVLPFFSPSSVPSCSLELTLQVLLAALRLEPGESQAASPHWIMDCSPFPILFTLCQLLDNSYQCWEEQADGFHVSMESKELLIQALTLLGELVGREVAADPSTWYRAISWLYGKVEALDWTVRFRLKAVWGTHFKNEVPSSLLAVCKLPQGEWSELNLDQYGPGTGLTAWAECCCLSDKVREILLSSLELDQSSPGEMCMFSKGLLVALTQVLPWCTAEEWTRLLGAVQELLTSDRLHTPYSLEYVDSLPLLDLRVFAVELRLSVLLLRVFQLMCSSSCSAWLPTRGLGHISRLYASAVRGIITSVLGKLRTPESAGVSEVLFALTQLFCHVLHVQVMLPTLAEPLYLCALELMTQVEAVLTAHPGSSSALERDDIRHLLSSIIENVDSVEVKAAMRQKIAAL
ncbi:gem-associated protein 4 [Scleropages formosus]|uniref:Gem (nuclear organelle) associated protein 4 n=1 Tax=Scleropages formosus TaxID=113540 RepID=A0A8C9V5I9_SCLFO|nr:gem-associated protein 4 [Scleropages formosus]